MLVLPVLEEEPCFVSFSVLRVCFFPQRLQVRSSVPFGVSVAFFVTVQGPQSCPRGLGASMTFSCGEKTSLLNTAVHLDSPAASQEAGFVTSELVMAVSVSVPPQSSQVREAVTEEKSSAQV